MHYCIGIERVIATPKVNARLPELLAAEIKKLRVGSVLHDDRVDVATMISNQYCALLEHTIGHAVHEGAKVIVGGTHYTHPRFPCGSYFSPTLIVDVHDEMAIANMEILGPVCMMMRAHDVTEAIHLANMSTFALGASVFGDPHSHDVADCVAKLHSRNVVVNDLSNFRLAARDAVASGNIPAPEDHAQCAMKRLTTKAVYLGSLIQISYKGFPILSLDTDNV